MIGFICYLIRDYWKNLLALILALLPIFSVGKSVYQFYSTFSRESAKCAPLIERLEAADRNFSVNASGSAEEFINALNAYNAQVGPSRLAILNSGIELITTVQAEHMKLSVKIATH